jgi:hypothetical protein
MCAHYNRADVMVTHPKRLVFAGIFVVALAVASFLPRMLHNALHTDQSASDGYDSSGLSDGTPDAPRTSGPVPSDKHSDASPAQILQAVRDSLHRNDLESAEVLLRAARALDINNEQAVALQHELDARRTQTQTQTQTQTASPAANPTDVVTVPQAESRSIPRTARTVNRTEQTRERTKRVPLHARDATDLPAELPASRNTAIEMTTTVATIPKVIEKSAPPQGVTPTVEAAPAVVPAPESAPAPAPVIPSMPAVQQTVRPEPAPVAPSPGPKSREQVRAELERARLDGSIPRFGNPDPAGPGVRTISKLPPETANR